MQNDISYLYLDITENMFNLKRFLKFRDNYEVFNEIKLNNRVGLPCIVVNNGEEIIFDIEKNLYKLK
ncbi:glutaredoxin-related protein [Sedimentibacter acidaminivorans]|uniref:Glutaredoxin-related protein n=1 Tax=Sedimentibacter acidaminivorans TaxID=913099 RepID=A0ABS4GAP6_9FIRM|nr:glutaredoxin [Sedimentibacter acidaminivorans]MBP1924754.1 glutaredoxin-related protein [Sedimentibacter acidaminivorans]